MSRFHSYLNSAAKIIDAYNGTVPLATWLKDYFRFNKQMGSKDRKQVAELVYGFYRLGHALKETPVQDKLLSALFLCNQAPHALLQHFKPEWNETIQWPVRDKAMMLQMKNISFHADEIFPWRDELSEGMDHPAFCYSFLRQPDVFLRIRPGQENTVVQKLQAAGIPYRQYAGGCLAVPHATKLGELLALDREAVVQDYSSQQTGRYFSFPASGSNVWDCCAASGGKSIMAYDINPAIRLTVSDVRASILHNLDQRFRHAGIHQYRSLPADLSVADPRLPPGEYDLIIADVPCSGSGTWSRTPEQLYFFQQEKINHYHELQKKIVSAAVKKLKKNGRLIYITCSVFRRENEQTVAYIQSELGLSIADTALLKGYDVQADSMFVTVLVR